jgi:hypothetical protein
MTAILVVSALGILAVMDLVWLLQNKSVQGDRR